MILVVHIAIALINVLHSTISIFSPAEWKVKFTYWLTAGTLASGVLLGFERHINLGHACLSGIAYVSLIAINVLLTKKRLSSVRS